MPLFCQYITMFDTTLIEVYTESPISDGGEMETIRNMARDLAGSLHSDEYLDRLIDEIKAESSSENSLVSEITVEDQYAKRIELAGFLGADYHNLMSACEGIEILNQTENEINIGSETVSITALPDGTIVRIGLREGDTTYCVEGTCPGQSTTEIEKYVAANNYDRTGYKNDSTGGEDWIVNERDNRFLMYQAFYTTIKTVYLGLDGYMPF